MDHKLRPTCPSCEYVHFFDPKVAAGVLVVKEGKVLLIQRGTTPHQGKWILPAGFVDAGEDPKVTATRECLEETGLQIELLGLMDVFFTQEHPAGADIVIIFHGQAVGGELKAGDDAVAVGFFSPDQLPPLGFDVTKNILTSWKESSF